MSNSVLLDKKYHQLQLLVHTAVQWKYHRLSFIKGFGNIWSPGFVLLYPTSHILKNVLNKPLKFHCKNNTCCTAMAITLRTQCVYLVISLCIQRKRMRWYSLNQDGCNMNWCAYPACLGKNSKMMAVSSVEKIKLCMVKEGQTGMFECYYGIIER